MRAVVQRVTSASVTVDQSLISNIGAGLLVLVGIEDADNVEDIQWLSAKLVQLRIFNDENGIMNHSSGNIRKPSTQMIEIIKTGFCLKCINGSIYK
jgi:D-tyrosyl-tRNA(Tyr) deacylase